MNNRKLPRILLYCILCFLVPTKINATTYVKSGDTGSMILPVKNAAESIGDMESVEIEVTAPSWCAPAKNCTSKSSNLFEKLLNFQTGGRNAIASIANLSPLSMHERGIR